MEISIKLAEELFARLNESGASSAEMLAALDIAKSLVILKGIRDTEKLLNPSEP